MDKAEYVFCKIAQELDALAKTEKILKAPTIKAVKRLPKYELRTGLRPASVMAPKPPNREVI